MSSSASVILESSEGMFGGGLGFDDLPPVIKRRVEEVSKLLKDPQTGIICVSGSEGIGSRRIAKYAVKASHAYFHVFRWFTVPPSPSKSLQTIIAESLGVQMPAMDEGEYDDGDGVNRQLMEEAKRIRDYLVNRRFLFVFECDKWADIGLGNLGIPIPYGWSDNKVVVVTSNPPTHVGFGIGGFTTIDLNIFGYDAWELFQFECREVANSLKIQRPSWSLSPLNVLDCFFHLTLYPEGVYIDPVYMMCSCVAIGILGGGNDEQLDDLLDMFNALLTELKNRSMILKRDSRFKMAQRARKLATYIVTEGMKGRRFMIKTGWGFDVAPKAEEWEKDGIERISLIRTGLTSLLDQPPKCPNLSTLLLYDTYLREIPNAFFNHMIGLHILDLSYNSISSLPSSLFKLYNLKYLDISGNNSIETLPQDLRKLKKLQFLFLHQNQLSEIPDEAFEGLNDLRYLNLSQTPVISLPSSIFRLPNLEHIILKCFYLTSLPSSQESFKGMHKFTVMDLSYAKLESLPRSLSNAINLKRLFLNHCSLLEAIYSNLQQLSSLEVLDLSYCRALEDIRDASFGNIMPKLRTLNLSNTPIIQNLHLRDHPSLETIYIEGLKNLEVLDLSGTKLRNLPTEISKLTTLKRLDMLEMKHIPSIDWENLNWLPQEINCHVDGSYSPLFNNNVGARMTVSSAKFFQSLQSSSPLWGVCFSRFQFIVSRTGEQDVDSEIHFHGEKFCYRQIYLSRPRAHQFGHSKIQHDKCLEISETESSLKGINGVVPHTQFLSLRKNKFLKRVSDHGGVENMDELRECWIEKCNRMEIVFAALNDAKLKLLPSLERIWISRSAKLRIVTQGMYGRGSFSVLKEVYLEYCPKLVTIFSTGARLPSLEKLEIKCCYRLKEVFEGAEGAKSSPKKLHTILLWELPKLESICNVYLSALQKMIVRGCPKLKKIPIHDTDEQDSVRPVAAIKGESKWWKNLSWEDASIKDQIDFKEWRRPLGGYYTNDLRLIIVDDD